MTASLYCVSHRTSGKLYVGITTQSVDKRWKAHCYNASRGVDTKFYAALRKYGPAAFDVVQLFAYPCLADAAAAEIECIAQLQLIETGYNAALGGHTGQPRGHKRSEKARAALKLGAAKRAADPAWREKMRAVALARSQNPEYRAKLSRALTGKKHSDATKKLIKEKRRNQITSPETRAKMSASHKQRWAELRVV